MDNKEFFVIWFVLVVLMLSIGIYGIVAPEPAVIECPKPTPSEEHADAKKYGILEQALEDIRNRNNIRHTTPKK